MSSSGYEKLIQCVCSYLLLSKNRHSQLNFAFIISFASCFFSILLVQIQNKIKF